MIHKLSELFSRFWLIHQNSAQKSCLDMLKKAVMSEAEIYCFVNRDDGMKHFVNYVKMHEMIVILGRG